MFFLFKQKTAYEMRISDWSSDVCSSDLPGRRFFTCCPARAVAVKIIMKINLFDRRRVCGMSTRKRTGVDRPILRERKDDRHARERGLFQHGCSEPPSPRRPCRGARNGENGREHV